MRRITQLFLALLFAVSLVPAAVQGQVDITVPWVGPYGDVGRGLVWGLVGKGGTDNAFIIDLPAPQTTACLFVKNNSTVATRTFTLHAYTTSDQTTRGYYLNPGNWEALNVVSSWRTTVSESYYAAAAIAGSGPSVFSIAPGSGGRIAIVISQGGQPGADTADIFYSFGSPSPCSAYIPPPNGAIFVDARTVTANIAVTWIGRATGAVYPGAPQTWSACSFHLITTNTAGTDPTLNVYVQSRDSLAQITDDRVSFGQATTLTLRQTAQILLDATECPHTALDTTLAAGTIVSGIFSDTVKLYYKIGGSNNPSYDVVLTGVCH